MLVTIFILCAFAHTLINFQKSIAFQKIEKRVAARLNIEKENAKMVSFPPIVCICCEVPELF